MSFWKCVEDAINEGSADRERGKRAQEMWKEIADRYERQGRERHMAEVLAGEDVKEAFKREAGADRHVYLSKLANLRKQQAEVAAAKRPDMREKMERLDYRHRGLVRRFNAKLSELLSGLDRSVVTGRPNKPAQMKNIVRELHGDASGDATAKQLADAVRGALEDMRLMFNEAGGIIGKLENWGLPHSHSRRAISKAGFDRWFGDISERLDWTRIEDPLTGRPMQPEGGSPPDIETRRRFLKETFDNITYGKDSREAVYGRPQGVATYRKHAERRLLHFKSADDWIDYNTKFGSGDPFAALMGHVHRMARDIALMREFGPNPGLGAEYRGQLWSQKARNTPLFDEAKRDTDIGLRMLRVMNGGKVPQNSQQEFWATFFSSTRHVLTSAFLDRAMVASISDVNSMRLAAAAVGINPANLFKRHVDLLASSMSRQQALNGKWVADSLSDGGVALARFQQEFAPAEFAEKLSTASMRLQGLTYWTDMGRVAFQMEFAGLMAENAGRGLADVDQPLQGFLRRHGINEAEWADLTAAENLYRAPNGGIFANPFWWRESTSMDSAKADALFDKIQGLIEEQMEYAVPTRSLLAQSFTDPTAYNIPPGTLPYEIMKSGTMFKSFAMTFTINQYRRIMSQPTIGGRIGYAVNLAAGATVMGGLALQLGDIGMGRDPQDMSDPAFWGRAALKGGGFGILGDIVATGQASWGGGFGSYLMGPMPQAAQDAWNLTVKNAYEFATGQETKFAQELGRMGKRYTPMGQTVAIGPALDRLFWDQLSILLDPEAADALVKASQRRANLNGANEDYWLPGKLAPSRAPNFSNAIGQ